MNLKPLYANESAEVSIDFVTDRRPNCNDIDCGQPKLPEWRCFPVWWKENKELNFTEKKEASQINLQQSLLYLERGYRLLAWLESNHLAQDQRMSIE